MIIAQKRTYPLTLNPEKARSKMPAFLEPASAFKRNQNRIIYSVTSLITAEDALFITDSTPFSAAA